MVKPSQPLVLIADDDAISLEIVRTFVEGLGCRVRAASSGSEAVTLFEEARGAFGLVLLDACMPGPSARVMYDRIRSLDASVPVLFCSGFSSDDPALRFIGDEGLWLLTKPFDRAVCVHAIRRALDRGEKKPPRGAAMSARIGLETPCPRCGEELAVVSGLPAELVRDTVRRRAAEYGFPVTCGTCRTETVLGPVLAAAPVKMKPVAVYSSR